MRASAAEQLLASASFLVRTLVAIAERRAGSDSLACRLALLHIEIATLLHRSLYRALACHRLTDVQFAVLVVLFSTEPDAIAMSVLAEHAAVSPSAASDALEKLESLDFARRTRDRFDRRVIYARITESGQKTVDAAVNDYLHVAEDAAAFIRPAAQRAMLSGYNDLGRGLSRPGQSPSGGRP